MQFAETSLENTDNAAGDSWLARLVAFIAWLFDAITRLKRVRRTTKFKQNWRDSFDGLRHSEWHRDQMLAQGAALLLSGQTLDDADYINHPMPADYGGHCPRTPFQMNRRFLALAHFMRDPETHIRRHAAKIAKRCGIDLANPLAAHGSTDATRRGAPRHDPVGVSSCSKATGALMLSRPRSGRPSKRERGLTTARGPPKSPHSQLPIASLRQQRRGRTRMSAP